MDYASSCLVLYGNLVLQNA